MEKINLDQENLDKKEELKEKKKKDLDSSLKIQGTLFVQPWDPRPQEEK